MKAVVAHIKYFYLGISETFIYEYITNFQRYKPIFIARETMNLNLFPFENLYCTPNPKGYSWQWIWEKSYKKIFKEDLFMRDLFRNDPYYKYITKKEKVKLIHAHFGHEGFRMLNLKKKLKLPLITTFYGFDMSLLPQQRKWRVVYKKLFREGDLFLVEGSRMKEALVNIGCPEQKIRIQHIAVDVNKFKYQERSLKSKDEKIRVLFCGRFVEKKGLIYALKAIKIAINKFPNLEFRIIGDGKLKPKIEDFIKGENIERYIIFLGYQPHCILAEEIQKAHILLQPSVTAQDGDSEGGAPTVLLEAQATGLPIISTYHADIPEVVCNGKSGFLVSERNPEALGERLDYLISNPGLWGEMGILGRKHVEENYNIKKEVKKLEDIYEELMLEHKSSYDYH